MTVWEAVILGIVQGATEFLPVSSSGHLVMGEELLGVETPGILFEVAVHVATLVSILIVYRTRVAGLVVGGLKGEREALRYIGLVVVATIPAGLVGVLAGDFIESMFDSPAVPAVALLLTGALLWSTRWAMPGATGMVPTWTAALLIGIAQAFAITPGISRSGTTVVAALWLGIEPREAAAFSFLMAVPAIAGAGVLQIPDLMSGGAGGLSTGALVWGSLAAAVTGVLAIRTLVMLLARRAFHLFAPYCWAVGALFLVYLALR